MVNQVPCPAARRERLTLKALSRLPSSIERVAYDPSAVTPGIFHLGLGAFMRAHLAVYTDDVLAAGLRNWAIVGANPSSSAPSDALAPQDGLYTVAVRGPESDRLRVIGALREALVVSRAPEATLVRLTDPNIRIVSLTVTEKGYCQDAATGTLDEAHPAIRADLRSDALPRSIPGILAEGLRRRRAAGLPPFTVMTCDNLARNGDKVRRIVARFAALRDPELGRFVAEEVAFPNTMVDRITPATCDADRVSVAQALGYEDAWPVVCEPFHQWVVEDRFPGGRPPWEDVGACLVSDVTPFEAMKLRCLNGTHSAMAYIGTLLGLETVDAAFSDPDVERFVNRLWATDLVPTVPPVPGVDVADYVQALAERYRNPRIRHRTFQIASDGSQKLPPRLLEPARRLLRDGATARHIAFVIAAWMRFVLRTDDQGRRYDLNDPLSERLDRIGLDCGRNAPHLAEALFSVSEVFAEDLARNDVFVARVKKDLDLILRRGTRQALQSCLNETSSADL